MNITLDDGRTELWQWDTGRKIVVDDKSVSEVHYSKYSSTQAITREVINGKAEIPNFLLQDTHAVTVYAYAGSVENGYTMAEKTFNVVKKPKPANYVETEEDKAILAKLKAAIGDLSELQTEAKNNLVSAINEAAASGGADKPETAQGTAETAQGTADTAKSTAETAKTIVNTCVREKGWPSNADTDKEVGYYMTNNRSNKDVYMLVGNTGGSALTIHVGEETVPSVTFTPPCYGGAQANFEFSRSSPVYHHPLITGIGGVVMYSSDGNSTKKFKITADDTGTLSATEVTT